MKKLNPKPIQSVPNWATGEPKAEGTNAYIDVESEKMYAITNAELESGEYIIACAGTYQF